MSRFAYPWRRILIPTDFSTASQWVFDDAIRAAASTSAELVILHVRMTRTSNPKELRFPGEPALYEYVEQQELTNLQEQLRRSNANVPTRLLVRESPDPGEEIHRAALEEGIDLVVMATHGKHNLAHLFVGSATRSLLGRCEVPVLAIRYGIQKRRPWKRILVGVDETREVSAALIDTAYAIALREGASLRFLVAPGIADRFAESSGGVPAAVLEAAHDKPFDREVVRWSHTEDADLTMIGHRCSPDHSVRPSEEAIVRHSERPVLVIPY